MLASPSLRDPASCYLLSVVVLVVARTVQDVAPRRESLPCASLRTGQGTGTYDLCEHAVHMIKHTPMGCNSVVIVPSAAVSSSFSMDGAVWASRGLATAVEGAVAPLATATWDLRLSGSLDADVGAFPTF